MQNYYTDVECIPCGEYSYFVTAYYPSGESSASNLINVFIDTEPDTPSNPIPTNNAYSISVNILLEWLCSDPYGDTLIYDVYFGTEADPPLVSNGQSETTYNPGTLESEETYYWQIVAHDEYDNSTTGGIWNFVTSFQGTVTDYDGNVYQTLGIGDQIWMVENLKVTHYRNGDAIPTGYSNSEWANLDDTETGAFCYYDNNSANGNTYGALYNWYAVDDSRGIAPEGWRVATDAEWMELEMALGMSESEANSAGWRGTNEGSKLAGNASLWNSGVLESNAAFGSSDFTALPGGYRSYSHGSYYGMGTYGYFWSSTVFDDNYAWGRKLGYNNSEVGRDDGNTKRGGFSLRCIRDLE
ncbi:MAG: fibrobacter succinogenes major paralogous domain-containing protein [Candidatus Cloacimonetes bacterium]|nr:fibrobacter succinogenes major paralogous domain-containing protein [Candidatus Cloacimonadota bacterium]